MKINEYLTKGPYTRGLPREFMRAFYVAFREKPHTEETVRMVIRMVLQYFTQEKYVTTTHNLALSRFLPIARILRMRLRTCGSIAAVAAAVLRALGYPTKLVDGKLHRDGKWRSHAWLEVYLPDRKRFTAFDPFSKEYRITRQHKRRASYRDWAEVEKTTSPHGVLPTLVRGRESRVV